MVSTDYGKYVFTFAGFMLAADLNPQGTFSDTEYKQKEETNDE